MIYDTSNPAGAYVVPSMMTPLVASLEPTGTTQRQQFWDWDWNSTTTQSSNHLTQSLNGQSTFLPASLSPYLDYLPPPLLPATTNFPYYATALPDCHGHIQHGAAAGLVKREEGADPQVTAAGQIGLNLGHRTYFSAGDALAIDRLFRRSRGAMYQLSSHQVPRCQAEGCMADLSDSKHYHRRHKVCEFHSKAAVVMAGGSQQRFCQQCSRFHVLSEFDEAKRSCRRRLADHNRRRRKPQPPPASEASSGSPDNSKQTGATSASTFSASNMSTEESRKDHDHQNQLGTHLTSNGPALSLGGGGYYYHCGLQGSYHGERSSPCVVVSEEVTSRDKQQQPRLSSPFSTPAASFSQHHNFCSSSGGGDAPHPVSGVGSDDRIADAQRNLLHLGQSLFEVDCNHFM